LKAYPEIEFKRFKERLQFQVQFIKKSYQPLDEQNIDIEYVGKNMGDMSGLSWDLVGTKLTPSQL